ncbi:MAG: hypothetical protein EZS28_009218 [Streblomastix strix]|uniref:Suppressor of forked domain-containing protein n=1 Tax=Streblomastix strix TaxID=222440 RepID=A0A5J4WJJ1_9EUKA|nr:MAG: hypothetical protein EZS28_009218 [Streblomastix strix]
MYESVRKAYPFNAVVVLAFADFLEKSGRVNEARNVYLNAIEAIEQDKNIEDNEGRSKTQENIKVQINKSLSQEALILIHYQRFIRRNFGVVASQQVFEEQILVSKSAPFRPEIFVAAAKLEIYYNGDLQRAEQIFEIGEETSTKLIYNPGFDNNSNIITGDMDKITPRERLASFVIEHALFLKDTLHQYDKARRVFECFIQLPFQQQESIKVWEEYLNLERTLGCIERLRIIEQRMSVAMSPLHIGVNPQSFNILDTRQDQKVSNRPILQMGLGTRLAMRYKFMNLDCCSEEEIQSMDKNGSFADKPNSRLKERVLTGRRKIPPDKLFYPLSPFNVSQFSKQLIEQKRRSYIYPMKTSLITLHKDLFSNIVQQIDQTVPFAQLMEQYKINEWIELEEDKIIKDDDIEQEQNEIDQYMDNEEIENNINDEEEHKIRNSIQPNILVQLLYDSLIISKTINQYPLNIEQNIAPLSPYIIPPIPRGNVPKDLPPLLRDIHSQIPSLQTLRGIILSPEVIMLCVLQGSLQVVGDLTDDEEGLAEKRDDEEDQDGNITNELDLNDVNSRLNLFSNKVQQRSTKNKWE